MVRQKDIPTKKMRITNFTQTLCHVTLDIGKLPSDSEKVIVQKGCTATGGAPTGWAAADRGRPHVHQTQCLIEPRLAAFHLVKFHWWIRG